MINSVFANAINRSDFAAAARQIHRRPRWLLGRLIPGRSRRVREAWAHTQSEPTHFWAVPAVTQRRAILATGTEELSVPAYVAQHHLGHGLRGISIGCGTGIKEATWAATGCFSTLECFDISSERIAHARQEHHHPALRFDTADAYALDFAKGSLDAIIFEDALHHLAPVTLLLERCRDWLAPGGTLIVHEYIGPRRFQYTRRQIETANALLAMLPAALRISYAHGTVKRRIARPSLLRMRLLDPSEAIESDVIAPTVRKLFNIVEERALGGTIVNLVLDDIAQNFVAGQDEWLRLMFAVEDQLLSTREIDSDYTLLIARA